MDFGAEICLRVTLTASKLVNGRLKEGSSFTAIASFFTDDTDVWVAATPTSAKYRIDRVYSPSCSTEVLGWTSLTPATSINIAITGAQNAVQSIYACEEPRQITVRANDSLATQYDETLRYCVSNIAGIT
jgi:hypothetical protein